jgi:hypothetical protein
MVRLVHVTTVPEVLTFFQGQVGYRKARRVDVWALSSPGEVLDQLAAREGVQVHGLEMPRRITPLRDLAATARLWRWLRKVRPDIVNAHTPKGGPLAMVGRGWRASGAGLPHARLAAHDGHGAEAAAAALGRKGVVPAGAPGLLCQCLAP